MKKDILYLPVEQVAMVIMPSEGNELWQVYLINRNKNNLETVLVTSKGVQWRSKNFIIAPCHSLFRSGIFGLN